MKEKKNLKFYQTKIKDLDLGSNSYIPSAYAYFFSEEREKLVLLGQRRLTSAIAEDEGVSKKQVQRYIRLTYLIPNMLEAVDAGIVPINVAAELSYLDVEQQSFLFSSGYYFGIKYNDAVKIKKLSQETRDYDDFVDKVEELLLVPIGDRQITLRALWDSSPEPVRCYNCPQGESPAHCGCSCLP